MCCSNIRPPSGLDTTLAVRHRIAQLESEVASLRKAVGDIQSNLGLPTAAK